MLNQMLKSYNQEFIQIWENISHSLFNIWQICNSKQFYQWIATPSKRNVLQKYYTSLDNERTYILEEAIEKGGIHAGSPLFWDIDVIKVKNNPIIIRYPYDNLEQKS